MLVFVCPAGSVGESTTGTTFCRALSSAVVKEGLAGCGNCCELSCRRPILRLFRRAK